VVDFTVTMAGLEEQSLGRVIAKEQKQLEELLASVVEELRVNRKSLAFLDDMLLSRLTDNAGTVLDDKEMMTGNGLGH
jgi:dynein heavy chain